LSDITPKTSIAANNIVTLQRTVLFGDCDPEGIVYTPRFSYYSVEAIQDALSIWLEDKTKDGSKQTKKSGGLRKLMDHGILPPARAFTLEFHHPVTWDDELSIKVWVCQITERSFSFQVEAWLKISRLSDAENILAFTAKLTQVCVSRESHQSIPLPDDLRARLSELLL
jgi:acyl-CoA thioesterase FadM